MQAFPNDMDTSNYWGFGLFGRVFERQGSNWMARPTLLGMCLSLWWKFWG